MADKAISELVSAEQITATDMFVLEQNNTAKKLTGQILLNWLTKAADGHGGIQSIVKRSTSGLTDTYRITLADTTTFDFPVTNGKSITSISKQSTSSLVDTYKISYNDGTSTTFTVTNGAKGDKGDNAYLWIKYASQKPTASSHSIGDVPDDWIGVYSGNSSTAPTDYTAYDWFQIKGEKGDTGDPATLNSSKVEYQVSDSGTIIPSGEWSASVPVVAQGKYLWTRTTISFNSGNPVAAYSVSRMGLDGSGSVSSVANISPNSNGNVPLTANDVGALPSSGGDVTGEIRMNGQPISGLNPPTEDTQAANKGYVDTQASKAAPVNLLDNSDFRNPVNQRGQTSYSSGYSVDRWHLNTANVNVIVGSGQITLKKSVSGGLFSQIVPVSLAGAQLTLAIKTSLGLFLNSFLLDGEHMSRINELPAYFGVRVQSGLTEVYIYFPNDAESVEFDLYWAALYEGDYTADTLPEYKPKGYGAELAECQRYYIHLGKMWRYADNINGFGLMAPVTCPVSMRMTPTVVGNSHRIFTSAGWKDVTLSSVATMSKNEFLLSLNSAEELENGATYLYEGVEALSADL